MIHSPLAYGQSSFFRPALRNQVHPAQAKTGPGDWQATAASQYAHPSVQNALALRNVAQKRVEISATLPAKQALIPAQPILALSNVAHSEAFALQAAGRQPFRTPPAMALAGQNRGVLHTGFVQATSPSSPLARTSPRRPPVPRPIAFKRCSSCS